MKPRARFDAFVREIVTDLERQHAGAVSRLVERCEAYAADGLVITAPITLSLEDPDALVKLERAQIEHVMAISRGSSTAAAAMLGLSRKGLYEKRRRHGLLVPKKERRTPNLESGTRQETPREAVEDR